MQSASVNDEWGEMSREHFDERCRPSPLPPARTPNTRS
jgi:hypothetical protein